MMPSKMAMKSPARHGRRRAKIGQNGGSCTPRDTDRRHPRVKSALVQAQRDRCTECGKAGGEGGGCKKHSNRNMTYPDRTLPSPRNKGCRIVASPNSEVRQTYPSASNLLNVLLIPSWEGKRSPHAFGGSVRHTP